MLKKLWVKGFRNLKETVVSFDTHQNLFIWGDNNQGKTNFLESVYFLGHGCSPVQNDATCLVNTQSDMAYLGGDYQVEELSQRVYFKVHKGGDKEATLDDKKIKSMSALSKKISIAFLSADVLRLFQDQPDTRRKELDGFCKLNNTQFLTISKHYEKALRQKNRALKSDVTQAEILIWNEQLAEWGSLMVQQRLHALKELELILNRLLPDSLEDRISTLTLSYQYKRLEIDTFERDAYKAQLLRTFSQDAPKERILGYSLCGAHRDDFSVVCDGHCLFDYFSRGINRSLAILFKLAQLILLKETHHTFPLLLLDDTFAELDERLKKKLLTLIQTKTQIMYTTVNETDQQYMSEKTVKRMVNGDLVHA